MSQMDSNMNLDISISNNSLVKPLFFFSDFFIFIKHHSVSY